MHLDAQEHVLDIGHWDAKFAVGYSNSKLSCKQNFDLTTVRLLSN